MYGVRLLKFNISVFFFLLRLLRRTLSVYFFYPLGKRIVSLAFLLVVNMHIKVFFGGLKDHCQMMKSLFKVIKSFFIYSLRQEK